jgi:catechol 2,3-dioxygenase-like lactoylglutathione lyase family enzyme
MVTETTRPKSTAGLRHVALFAQNFEKCVDFYTRIMAMQIEWQPDADNVYLTSGNDNLALHRARQSLPSTDSRLDHIGFIVNTPDEVDRWFVYMQAENVVVNMLPKTHRDGARSFYCQDPDGNHIQIIFHPPISRGE